MNIPERAEAPVLIVGAGPVGLMLACELGIAGVRAMVVDKLAVPGERMPGMAINSAVVELLDQRGLMAPLRDDGFEFPLAHFAHLMLDPARLAEPHPFAFAVPHSRLAERLADRAAALGVQIRRGAEVTGLDQDAGGVSTRLASGEVIRSQYLVGCDGGHSTVRALAGIGFGGTDLDFRGIIADLDVEPGDVLLTRLGFHQHDAGLFTVAPAAPGVVRVTVGEFGLPPGPDRAPLTLADLQASVQRVTGTELTTGSPRWIAAWSAPTRLADRYRAGRVFLAGDAAHLLFPLGGQALSTGVEDAVNLGWKLAAEVNGWAPAGLLGTYHAERHPAGARACLSTRAQTALMHSMGTVGPLREILAELIKLDSVNEYMVKMVGGLDVRYQVPDGAGGPAGPLAGTRVPGLPLVTGHGSTSLTRLLERGHGVLLVFAPDAALSRLAGGWSGRLDLVVAEPTPQLDATAVLIRPDGRVAWSCRDTRICGTGLAAAVHRWFGEPTAVRHDDVHRDQHSATETA